MKWFFPSNNGGDINGIGNGYLEHFQGTRLKSLAREICQNSLDAAINENEPVIVEFKSFSLDLDEMPDYESRYGWIPDPLPAILPHPPGFPGCIPGSFADDSSRYADNGPGSGSVPFHRRENRSRRQYCKQEAA